MKNFWPRPVRRKNAHKTFSERFGKHLLALLILLVSVILGFFVSFPDTSLQRLLERELTKQAGTPVMTEHARLRFPGRLEIDRLTTTGTPAWPLDIDRLNLSPVWTTLLADQPGWNFTIASGDGTIDGQIDSNRRLTAQVDTVPLTLPLPGMKALTLSGRLTSGNVDAPLSLTPDPATNMELTLDNLTLSGLKLLTGKTDELKLGRLSFGVKGAAGTYRVERLQLAGAGLEASGNLTITPANPLKSSRLNGTLTLQPTAELNPDIAALLPLLGKKSRAGDYRLRLSGTLAAPRLR